MEIPGLSWIGTLGRRLRFLLRRDRYTAELEEEMRLHQQLRATRYAEAGVAADEATRLARRRFGRAVAHVETSRDAWGLRAADVLAQDVRYAVRSLSRTPGLALAVVLTLALGLGANAAIFSILDRIFFRMPAGVAAPRDVLRLYDALRARDAAGGGAGPVLGLFDYAQYARIRDAVGPTAHVVVYDVPRRVGFGSDSARRVFASLVGPGYFSTLGVRPALGRFFAPDEQRVEEPASVIVLGYDFWQREFGGDSAVLGRRIPVGRLTYTVVGVAQRGFAGVDLDAADFWWPLGSFRGFYRSGGKPRAGAAPWYAQRGTLFLSLLARPRGTSAATVAARATVGLRRDNRTVPGRDTLATVVTGSLVAARGPANTKQEFALSARLAGVALIVLLIACANVANLLLARAVQRRREVAVRLAMGISRRRLAGLLLTESALLAVLAGGAALVAGAWAGALLRAFLLPEAHWEAPTLDARLAAFTAAVALVAALAAGLAPALQSTRTDLTIALKSGARDGGPWRARLRTALVVTQSALSAVLLVGAGLFVRSLHNVASTHTGYDVDRLVFVAPSLPAGRPTDGADDASAIRELSWRLAAMPGIERVALVSNPPMWGISAALAFRAGGDTLGSGLRSPMVTGVSPGYFAAVGTRVVRGRGLQDAGGDGRGTVAREIVINETMARLFWPDADPVGDCVRVGKPTEPCSTVVGIVEDAHQMQLIEEPRPHFYVPAAIPSPEFLHAGWIVVRAAPGRAGMVAEEARALVRQLWPGADARVLEMAEILAPQLRPWRLGATLFTAFGALALLVAAMGVYSTLTYMVSQRANEIGVRVALGARGGDVMRLVVGSGVRVVAAGVAAGIALSLVLGRLVAALLFDVSPRDPATMTAAAVTLLAVAAVAALLPAWRAARVDPVTALRVET